METEGQREYQKYLATDYWKKVSEAVKARAGYRCAICNTGHHLQAHHRTYDHRGNEMEHLDDLTCLCDSCHGRYHKILPKPPVLAKVPKKKKKKNRVKKPKSKRIFTPTMEGELVLITETNRNQLRSFKEPYHWMVNVGIDPTKSGWRKRSIGHSVPAWWMFNGPPRPQPVVPPPPIGGGMARVAKFERVESENSF